ncbi:MAG: hypothetical protein NTZ90_13315 [Proteobacteria bacterium]|nr:hypothetical protein [Pseudomonadota bacterium]
MDHRWNGTNFLGVTAVAQASALAHTRLYRFLAAPDAADAVMRILVAHLALTPADLALVEDFTLSLGGAGRHLALVSYFQQMAEKIVTDAELAAYVVQEFFVSTNFIAYYKGEAPRLQMLADLEQGPEAEVALA